jgi:hypothetical protein
VATIINGKVDTNYWTFKLEVSEGAPDIPGNTSPVTVDIFIGRVSTTGSYMYGASISGSVSVTGAGSKTFSYKNSGQVNIAAGAWLKIATVTFPAVPHDSDGSKTVTVSASFTNNIKPTSGSASGSVELTTIARASQPSCVTWPEHTQDVGEFGDTISIHMNRKDGDFTHTVRYEYGSLKDTIATNVETGTTWTIPLSFMDLIPKDTSGSGRIYVDTYNGTTLVGTKYCGFTAKVPASVKPTVSATLEDIANVDDIYGKPVAGLSKIKVKASAIKAYSSNIKSYNITIDGATYDTQEATTGLLQNAGTTRVTVTATDERGRKGSWDYDMTVLAYTRPQVTELAVHRTNGDYTENDQGEYVCVTFSTAVNDMGGKNLADYTLRYKKTTESNWSTLDLAEIDNNFNIFHYAVLFEASVSSSYDVELTAVDRHHSATRTTSASTAFSLMDWHSSGTGLRFGGVAEEENTLQNDLVLKQTANRYVFSTPGVASQAGYVCMARLTHLAANADTPITFIFTRRLEATPMTVYVQFRTDSTTADPALKGITYEGSNYGAFIVKSAESVWDLYVQKVSAYDTVTLQDWYSSRTIAGRLDVTFPGNLEAEVPQGLVGYYRATPAKLQSILDYVYPVGSVYINYSHVSPATLFGGTWERLENAFLWGVDENGTIGQTGGEKTHTLSVDEMPSHNHSVYGGFTTTANNRGGASYEANGWIPMLGGNTYQTANALTNKGAGKAHNNMPPYVQVSIWRRTA